MTSRLTLGVIGHVDHGKTALVRALTGMETDRLEEEKRRGLSIVLGYAWMRSGERMIDLIDAPGHEAFVRTMVLGATGFDAALLVVAADEGIKPQTLEHLAIARVFGLERRIVVAITKADRLGADRGERMAALGAVLGALVGDAVIVETSARTGEGMAELAEVIGGLPAPDRGPGGPFWLPVDRAFLRPGFGLVATGTLHDGAVHEGQEIRIAPGERLAQVRQVQVHGERVASAEPGGRVALNLRHVSPDNMPRGALIAPSELPLVGDVLEGEVTLDAGWPGVLRSGQRLRLMVGAAEAGVRVQLLGAATAQAGASTFVRLHADRPVAAVAGGRFLLRTPSPAATLGGGTILDLATGDEGRRTKRDAEAVERLRALAAGDGVEAARAALRAAGPVGRPAEAVRRWLGVAAPAADMARRSDGRWVLAEKSAPVPPPDPDREVERAVEQAFCAFGLVAPKLDEVVGKDAERRAALERLLRVGRVVKLRHAQGGEPRLVHRQAIGEAEARLRAALPGPFTAAAARDALGLTRRDTLPLLEHWDAAGVTRRRAELRTFAKPPHGGD